MAVPDISIVPESYDEFDLTVRLNKDVEALLDNISPTMVRILVDVYYQIQENRKATANQLLAAKKATQQEPNAFVLMLSAYLMKLEKGIVKALDKVTDQTAIGRWCKSNHGVGPVLTAALGAHIDTGVSKTASAVLRYGGYDPSVKWHGKEAVSELIHTAREIEADDWHAYLWLCRAFGVHPSVVLAQTHENVEAISIDEAFPTADDFLVDHPGDKSRADGMMYYGDNVIMAVF